MSQTCTTAAQFWAFLCGAGFIAIMYVFADNIIRLRAFVLWLRQLLRAKPSRRIKAKPQAVASH
jgi:hypothetical protein